jgi:NADPH2:quinone reductase
VTTANAPAWQVAAFGDPAEALQLVDLPREPLGPRDMQVAVAANGLNALDVSICRGTHPLRPTPPFVLGAELVGVVTEVGPDVRDIRVGERVVGMNPSAFGCFRAEARVPEQAAQAVPDEIPDGHAAALLITYQAAHAALVRRARVTPSDWVLINGAGGAFGSALTQLATALGGRVIATASSDDRRLACRELGAVAVLDGDPQRGTLASEILDITNGHGADVICDLQGGDFLTAAVPAAAFEARLISCGWASGSPPDLDATELVTRNLTLGGVSWGASYPRLAPEAVREAHAQFLKLYRAGSIRPLIGQSGSHRDLPDLLEAIAARRTIGKSVIEWPP